MKHKHMVPCVIGLVAAAAVLVGFGGDGARFALILLVCPVMMFLMMRMMMSGKNDADVDEPRTRERIK